MTIIRLIFAAALASFAVANVDEVSNDGETFAEATAFVQSFSSMHVEGDSACLKVADDAIKVIADECKALQGVIDNASKANQKCCQSGSVAACKAKNQHASFVGAHSTCLSQLDTIKKKTVNLGSVSYSSLAGKTCEGEVADHTKNSAFKAIKSEVEKKTKECYEKKGLKNAAKKFYDDAVKTAASSQTTCNANGQTALTKAFTDGKAACGSATNQKAFTRAEHMKCVLKGTNLADCSKNMPKPPAVKETTLSTLNCAAQTGGSSQCGKEETLVKEKKAEKTGKAPTPKPLQCNQEDGTGTTGRMCCGNANYGSSLGVDGHRDGFWVKRAEGSGKWNSGCFMADAAPSSGKKYTLYARWDPKGNNLKDKTGRTGVIAMWGFENKKSAEDQLDHFEYAKSGIDFAFYCRKEYVGPGDPSAIVYENGNFKGNTPCKCGDQTESWITMDKNGQVKYYMQSNHHDKMLCYTSKTKATNFPYVADTSIRGGSAKVWGMKVTSK